MRTPHPFFAVLFAAFTGITHNAAQADTFGSGTNQFQIDFVTVGNPGNAADATGYGAVPYVYRIGKYEITDEAVRRAVAGGLVGVWAGRYTYQSSPAGNIGWYEAAAFVNWLNTSTGRQAAYNLTWNGSTWSGMQLWDTTNSWTAGGTNRYRHKDAYYFLPNDNEWYKAAYYNPVGTNYFLYATGSSTAPTAVASGTNPGTAVYFQSVQPAGVDVAGGLSPYGTMGQSGNLLECIDAALDGVPAAGVKDMTVRGGAWLSSESALRSSFRSGGDPRSEDRNTGLRVASVATATTNVVLTAEKTTNLNSSWQFAPITSNMITPDGELNFGTITNTNEFYRLKIRMVVH